MNQLRIAIEQQETGAEKFLRDVLLKDGDCRFRLEIRLKDKNTCRYDLHSVSKNRAILEANEIVKQVFSSNNDESMMWQIPGVTNWQITPAKFSFMNRKALKKSWWNRFVNYFFEV